MKIYRKNELGRGFYPIFFHLDMNIEVGKKFVLAFLINHILTTKKHNFKCPPPNCKQNELIFKFSVVYVYLICTTIYMNILSYF